MLNFFQTEIQKKTSVKDLEEQKEAKAVHCVKCMNKITEEKFSTQPNNSHVHSFANPYGYVFTIRCFSSAPGAVATGDYSSEFTWFENYMWKISLCSKCKNHVGWKFSGKDSTFFGFIQDRIF